MLLRGMIVVVLGGCAPGASPSAGSSESSGSGDASDTSTTSTGTTLAATTESTSETSSSGVDTTDASSDGSSSSTGGCVERLAPLDEVPALLSETGLFSDIATRTLAADVLPFAPRFALWSDGASKSRWVWLPECEPIDTSDMDDWELPVGTRLWKQFTRDDTRIETRLITRYGPGDAQWRLATYLWNGDDAERVSTGVEDALGTDHDVPDEVQCTGCHRQDWRVLGFSAIQLAHDGDGVTLQALQDADKLSDPPLAPIVVPGDATAQAALGMLHANCGSCHSESGVPFVELQLRLRTTDLTVEDTQTWQSTVDVPTVMFECDGCDLIEPGVPETSAVVMRMLERGPDSEQMPPIATELVDTVGVDALSAWILTLPAG